MYSPQTQGSPVALNGSESPITPPKSGTKNPGMESSVDANGSGDVVSHETVPSGQGAGVGSNTSIPKPQESPVSTQRQPKHAKKKDKKKKDKKKKDKRERRGSAKKPTALVVDTGEAAQNGTPRRAPRYDDLTCCHACAGWLVIDGRYVRALIVVHLTTLEHLWEGRTIVSHLETESHRLLLRPRCQGHHPRLRPARRYLLYFVVERVQRVSS